MRVRSNRSGIAVEQLEEGKTYYYASMVVKGSKGDLAAEPGGVEKSYAAQFTIHVPRLTDPLKLLKDMAEVKELEERFESVVRPPRKKRRIDELTEVIEEDLESREALRRAMKKRTEAINARQDLTTEEKKDWIEDVEDRYKRAIFDLGG